MNALELAQTLEKHWPNTPEKFNKVHQAAEMLRRQHEAIQKLRKAITQSQECVSWPHTSIAIRDALEQALKDTEGL